MSDNYTIQESCRNWHGEYTFDSLLGYTIEDDTDELAHTMFHFIGDLIGGILSTKDAPLRSLLVANFLMYMETITEIAQEAIDEALTLRSSFVEVNLEEIFGSADPYVELLEQLTEEELEDMGPPFPSEEEEEEDNEPFNS